MILVLQSSACNLNVNAPYQIIMKNYLLFTSFRRFWYSMSSLNFAASIFSCFLPISVSKSNNTGASKTLEFADPPISAWPCISSFWTKNFSVYTSIQSSQRVKSNGNWLQQKRKRLCIVEYISISSIYMLTARPAKIPSWLRARPTCQISFCAENLLLSSRFKLPEIFKTNKFRKVILHLSCSNMRLDSLILQLVLTKESYERNGICKSKQNHFCCKSTVGVPYEMNFFC